MKRKSILGIVTALMFSLCLTVVASANTMGGNAGKSWCYLNPIRDNKAVATIGCSTNDGKWMQALTYYITYTNDALSDDYGAATPFSSSWSKTKVPEFRSKGWKTALYTGYAISDGRTLSINCPSDATYVY